MKSLASIKCTCQSERRPSAISLMFIYVPFQMTGFRPPFLCEARYKFESVPEGTTPDFLIDPDELSPHFAPKMSCYCGISYAYFTNGCLGLVCMISCLFSTLHLVIRLWFIPWDDLLVSVWRASNFKLIQLQWKLIQLFIVGVHFKTFHPQFFNNCAFFEFLLNNWQERVKRVELLTLSCRELSPYKS